MNAVVATYTMESELYGRSSAMIDLPFAKRALHDWSPDRHIVDLLKIDADWIVHVDEDAFVYDPHRIVALMQHMEEHQIACCGMPDGGAVAIRSHNPVACNPFFLIINRKLIRSEVDAAADAEIVRSPWDEAYRRQVAPFVLTSGEKYLFDEFEPYYGFFFWLCRNSFRLLYLQGRPWPEEPEGISTQLMDHTGTPFLIHTWYSRSYKRCKPSLRGLIRSFLRGLWELRPGSVYGVHYARIRRAMEAASRMSASEERSGVDGTTRRGT